jgi:RNA 3'-terminal phosphate cyclase (ATP)
MSTTVVELDGSFGEGGGQILRSSLALSLLTGKAFHLRNIRARRPRPGLQPQHLMSVRASATIGQAKVRGASIHSTDLLFEPGEVSAGKYHFAIGTAGATGLVLHTLYLPLALRGKTPSELTITGGTHNPHSPCFDFLQTTWKAYMEQLGLRISLHMDRPGFYPRGGGVLLAVIEPCGGVNRLRLAELGTVTKVTGRSIVAGLPDAIARRQARRAVSRLRGHGIDARISEEFWQGGPGTVQTLSLGTTPVSTLFVGLGARGKPAECVADEAVEQVLAYLAVQPPAVDAHSGDQLVLPLAFAAGNSSFRVAEVTPHLLTNLAVIRRFLDRDIRCDGDEGQPGTVSFGGAFAEKSE